MPVLFVVIREQLSIHDQIQSGSGVRFHFILVNCFVQIVLVLLLVFCLFTTNLRGQSRCLRSTPFQFESLTQFELESADSIFRTLLRFANDFLASITYKLDCSLKLLHSRITVY